jgi:hypothetical protein
MGFVACDSFLNGLLVSHIRQSANVFEFNFPFKELLTIFTPISSGHLVLLVLFLLGSCDSYSTVYARVRY